MSSHHDESGRPEAHDLGLSHDLPLIVERRRLGRRSLLGLLGGVGVVAVAGCSPAGGELVTDTAAGTTATPTPTAASPGTSTPSTSVPTLAPSAEAEPPVDVAAGEIPEETAGPFPADGSNGPDLLAESGVVRSDLRSSFGEASGVAEGVPTTLTLTIYDLAGTEVAPLAGAAVYVWHCDREGRYSMYEDDVADENYLRGVQETAADGTVRFTTVFPGAYDGRWPHVHFEVYASLADATTATNKLSTSQLALPRAACDDVYANAAGYQASIAHMQRTSLERDMVFSDGYSLQMARATGSAAEGYAVSLNVPV